MFRLLGKIKITLNNGIVNSEKYQEILQNFLLLFIYEQNLPNIVFQQDNARPHVSVSTKNWLEDNNIETMYWPPFSPDLNPIENVWGELSRLFYSNGKTYDNLIDLKNSITENWELISERYCKKLVDSMEKRIKQVIEKDGASINY